MSTLSPSAVDRDWALVHLRAQGGFCLSVFAAAGLEPDAVSAVVLHDFDGQESLWRVISMHPETDSIFFVEPIPSVEPGEILLHAYVEIPAD